MKHNGNPIAFEAIEDVRKFFESNPGAFISFERVEYRMELIAQAVEIGNFISRIYTAALSGANAHRLALNAGEGRLIGKHSVTPLGALFIGLFDSADAARGYLERTTEPRWEMITVFRYMINFYNTISGLNRGAIAIMLGDLEHYFAATKLITDAAILMYRSIDWYMKF